MIILLALSFLYYVDQPYLVSPGHGNFDVQLRFGPTGEILGVASVSVWNRFSAGISYGASNLIGAGNPEFYEIPGVQARIVAIEQGFYLPQLMIGFDNQGYGGYENGRYLIRSKGLYGQVGKAFAYPDVEFAPSMGMNYCFEAENRLDVFAGMRTVFGRVSALNIDYCPNFGDERDQDKGYLNISLQIIFYDELFFEFALRDLLDNSPGANMQLNRMIRVGYASCF